MKFLFSSYLHNAIRIQMFHSRKQLETKTGPRGIGRESYIKMLVAEYGDSNTTPANKHQVLANLANFAYDPINLDYLRWWDFVGVSALVLLGWAT